MGDKKHYRVLVVDDDDFVRDLVSTILRRLGCQTLQASDGQQAYDMAQQAHPSMIISDVMMPRLDGISLCRRLRSKGIQTPFFLLSNAEGSHSLNSFGSQANGWLPKPLSPDRLAVLLRRVIQKTRQAQLPGQAQAPLAGSARP